MSDAAKKRWKILGAAIRKAAIVAAEEDVSVRRFQTFGLINKSTPSLTDIQRCNQARKSVGKEELADGDPGHWTNYSFVALPDGAEAVVVYDKPQAVTLKEMMGFNNTGNVCIWPSEEVLAHYCLSNLGLFEGRTVLELGSGKGPLAGLAIAYHCETAKSVVLTDGNQQSVDNINATLPFNEVAFGTTTVSAAVLRWSKDADLSMYKDQPFDVIICADCFFFDEVRADLLFVMKAVLASKVGNIACVPHL